MEWQAQYYPQLGEQYYVGFGLMNLDSIPLVDETDGAASVQLELVYNPNLFRFERLARPAGRLALDEVQGPDVPADEVVLDLLRERGHRY